MGDDCQGKCSGCLYTAASIRKVAGPEPTQRGHTEGTAYYDIATEDDLGLVRTLQEEVKILKEEREAERPRKKNNEESGTEVPSDFSMVRPLSAAKPK